jgi:hypothetical protein
VTDVVGGVRDLYLNVVDPVTGQPADPTLVVLTVQAPDKTTSTPIVTRLSQGKYKASIGELEGGVYGYSWVATGAYQLVREGTFYVSASSLSTVGALPDPLIIDARMAMQRANLHKIGPLPVEGTEDYANVVEFLLEVQGVLRAWLKRPLSVQQVTETLYADRMGDVRASRTPVVSVTSVTPVGDNPDLLAYGPFSDTSENPFGSSFDLPIADGVRFTGFSGIALLDSTTPSSIFNAKYRPGAGFTITYSGGLDGPNIPEIRALLMIGATRALNAWRTDTEGILRVDLGEGVGYQFARLTGQQTDPLRAGWYTQDELDKIRVYRRKVVNR